MDMTGRTTSGTVNTALALIRIMLGVVFLAHGAQKVFTLGLPAITEGFTQMGVPMPGITAPLISWLEIVGGLALIVGLLTRVAAILLAADMAGAVLLVHLPAGFFLPTGYEFALTLLVILIAVVLMGPGAFSVDHALEQRRVAHI